MSVDPKQQLTSSRERPTHLSLALREGSGTACKIDAFLSKSPDQNSRKRKLQESLDDKDLKRLNKSKTEELSTIDIRDQLKEYMNVSVKRIIDTLTQRTNDDRDVFQQQIIELKEEVTKVNSRLAILESRSVTQDAEIQARLAKVEAWTSSDNLEGAFKSINKQLNKHANCLNNQERRSRENNLVISGLEVSRDNAEKEINTFLLSKFGLKDQVIKAKLLSKPVKKPLVLIKMSS